MILLQSKSTLHTLFYICGNTPQHSPLSYDIQLKLQQDANSTGLLHKALLYLLCYISAFLFMLCDARLSSSVVIKGVKCNKT